MIGAVDKLLEDLRQKVRLMVGRAILAAVNDSGSIQLAQANCLADETHDDVERIQEYGFTSVPLAGAEAVLVFPGGNRDHGLIIAVDDRRYRLQALANGEVAIYDDQGQKCHIKRTGIEISALNILLTSPGVIRIDGDKLELHGRTYLQSDVHGKGSRETWAGGTVFNTDSYQTGATGSSTEHGIDVPDIPATAGV